METNTSVPSNSPADTIVEDADDTGYNPNPTNHRELTGREIVTSFFDKGLWHVVIEGDDEEAS